MKPKPLLKKIWKFISKVLTFIIPFRKMRLKPGPFDPKKRKITNRALSVVSILLFLAGGYLMIITVAPNINFIPSSIDLNTSDDVHDSRNRIQIPQIDLEISYRPGDVDALNDGAWWRHEDRGNPKDGGNFILSAHRFYIGLTPQNTKERSPFYRLEELDNGSEIRIFYDGKWYDYVVTKKFKVEPNAIEIEDRTEEHIMTLYTCTLQGSADGRVVIHAKLRSDVSLRE